MVVTRTVSLFAWICLIGTDGFIVGQNGGITDNSHIWWQIPFHASSASTKRLGSNRGLAGLAARYPSMADLTISGRRLTLTRNKQREQVHNIKDALQYISTPSSVQVTSPSRPGVTLDASQQVLIETLPPILVLHMKRFLYDTKVNGVVKIGKQVSFGPELEIQPDIIAPARKTSQSAKYKLFGSKCLFQFRYSLTHPHHKFYIIMACRHREDTTPLTSCIPVATSTLNREKAGCASTMS